MSLTYIRKRNGPKTEPCGISQVAYFFRYIRTSLCSLSSTFQVI